MNTAALKDIMRRLKRLERASARVRKGVVTSTGPLAVDLGDSGAAYENVSAIDGLALEIGDVVTALMRGNEVVVLGRLTSDPALPQVHDAPTARAVKTSGQSIAHATVTKVTLSSTTWDKNHGGTTHFDNGNDRLICREAGIYLILAQVTWALVGGAERQTQIKVNGSQYSTGTAGPPASGNTGGITDHIAQTVAFAQLGVGDYVEVWAYNLRGVPDTAEGAILEFARIST